MTFFVFISTQRDQTLMAFQIAFDLYEGATQQFLSQVTAALQATVPFSAMNGVDSNGSAEGKNDKNGTPRYVNVPCKLYSGPSWYSIVSYCLVSSCSGFHQCHCHPLIISETPMDTDDADKEVPAKRAKAEAPVSTPY